MYNARLINDTAYDHHRAPIPLADRLYAREAIVPGLGGVLTAREPDFDIEGRVAWIYISIKNRSFNRGYICQFIDMCESLEIEGRICAVDTPYNYNAMAELGVDSLPEKDADKITRLSTDFQRMVAKAIRGKLSKRVQLVQWDDLEENTPQLYKDELAHAFHSGTRLRDRLFDHISTVKPISDDRQFERFANFFLCEVPVLLHAYYANGATLDIYPGPQVALFWRIELGDFAEELPHLTALTQQGRPMLYFDTHNRRKVNK